MTGVQTCALPILHKDRNGKLIAGPVWDFDWDTFRNSDQFMIKNCIWYEGLFKNPEFVEIVKSRWYTFYPGFTSILNEIEYERSYIRDSWIMNAALWPIENSDINGDEKMEFDDAIDRLKYNYNQRLTWLNKAINEL